MGRGSGSGGIPKSKIGRWINIGSGKRRVGIIFNKPVKINGTMFAPFGARWNRGGTASGFYNPKTKDLFNSRYDISKGYTTVRGDTWDVIQEALK